MPWPKPGCATSIDAMNPDPLHWRVGLIGYGEVGRILALAVALAGNKDR